MKILKMKELKPLSWGNYKNEKSEKHQKKIFLKPLKLALLNDQKKKITLIVEEPSGFVMNTTFSYNHAICVQNASIL